MKAQVVSLDLLFAVIVILTIISALGIVMLQYTTLETQISSNRDAELKAQSAINSLTQTGGNPPN
jgi:Tfp pilus assembly protein PilX